MSRATADLRHDLNLWKRTYPQTSSVSELRSHTRRGLALYEDLSELESAWVSDVRSGVVPLHSAEARELQSLYHEWLANAERVLAWLEQLDSMDVKDEDVVAVRGALQVVRAKLSMDFDRIVQSAQQAESGRTRPLQDIRDELRRRVDG